MKTLEEQIKELWKSRGLIVETEEVKSLGNGRYSWTIIAKEVER